MSSSANKVLTLVALAIAVWAVTAGQAAKGRFYPDDPIKVDRDTEVDAGKVEEFELSEGFDFLENTFGDPGDKRSIKAVNVNTLDEVPDSSWFTNRIGQRPMSIDEIVRGPDKFQRLENDEWLIVAGKGPGGLQPGFRAVDPANPKQIYQLEVDPPTNPEMATGAEMIGTALYHAIGYNVVDVYIVQVDPDKIRISETARIRDASVQRRFVRGDLDAILR
ncbi:MAG: hypothetical protein ACRD1T_12375, partial [Acidimicrobiia bacterium]